jgi:hypothetical protein
MALPNRLLAGMLLGAALVAGAGCGGAITPQPSPERRTWQGPTAAVASTGVTVYERRELAQKVTFPTCITIGGTAYRFARVRRTGDSTTAGTFDTGYGLDRWRLFAAAGPLDQQAAVFVSVLGSTGILAEYPRLPAGDGC